MALTAPTADLTGNTIASTYDQLLILDSTAGIVENTLKVVSTQIGKSALQLSDEQVRVTGVDTANAAAFEVMTANSAASIFKIAANTPAITINAATVTLTQDTNFVTSGGVNGMSIDGTTFSVDGTNNRVGIGTAAPDHVVHISADKTGSTNAVCRIENSHSSIVDDDIILILDFVGDADATAGHFIQFSDSDTSNMGAVVATNASVVTAGHSDYRSKENIVLMSSGLAEVNNLKPSQFKFKNYPGTCNGFIAHEVQEVVPNAVFGEKDAVDADGNMKAQLLAMEQLIPFMVKAIQELSAKVTALENA